MEREGKGEGGGRERGEGRKGDCLQLQGGIVGPGRQTDGRAIAYSEREREFTSRSLEISIDLFYLFNANNGACAPCASLYFRLKENKFIEIKMAERKGKRSSSKSASAGELTWSAWAQKYAAKAAGKYRLFGVIQCTYLLAMPICRNKTNCLQM